MATAIEYGLIATGISLAIIAVVHQLDPDNSTTVRDAFMEAAKTVKDDDRPGIVPVNGEDFLVTHARRNDSGCMEVKFYLRKGAGSFSQTPVSKLVCGS